jgi:hypothetical protein
MTTDDDVADDNPRGRVLRAVHRFRFGLSDLAFHDWRCPGRVEIWTSCGVRGP